ncbi:MAG: peptide ABC transporter substrate-binding protein [Oxalobacteraceae bacterium]|nr:MAG: peptide ABC transporter substrate-binding protein [Oxalobacteraceae bacterium]
MRSRSFAGKVMLGLAALAVATAVPALAQKKGGTLRMYHNDNPPSASLLEESTVSATGPFMAVFNNLVMFDQLKAHETIETIVPDLAESWWWDSTNTKLTFKLRQGVKWHDGKPFTAKDVQCTWHMLIGKSDVQDFRKNPRKIWYSKLQEVTVNGDHETTFNLSEPQPALPMLLASGFSAVYPCHVPQSTMRTRPVGTGPFKFVEFKRGDSIRLVRNQDYWKKDRPYLDEITFKIIENRSTRILAFATGEFDLTYPSDVTVPLMRDIQSQAPKAVCELNPSGVSANLLVNREVAPFNDANIRKAMSLAIDRKVFNTILQEGKAVVGGGMLPKPGGEWGMPEEMVNALPGYGPDTEKSLKEAQSIMEKLGYSAAKPYRMKIPTRNLASYRDPAVILIDQLKKIYIEGELDVVDTPQWYAKVARKDYTVGFNLTGVSVDDPDGNLVENYSCKSERNYTQYCNAEVDKLLSAQSREGDKEKRRKIVWEIEKLLVDDAARPIIQHGVSGNCWQPYVKNYKPHDNSIYNNTRFEDVWLDK